MHSPWRLFLAASGIAFALMALWSQATPLMSVTDEPSHAIRAAATVRGELVGEEGPGAATGRIEFAVPQGLADTYALTCTAWTGVSAACQPDVSDDLAPLVAGDSSAQTNLPVYYAIVGLPSLVVGGEAAMHAMRLVNALLCALLVGAAVAHLGSLPRRRFAIVGLAAAALPTAVYLSGTINPNSVEWAGALALTAALVALGRTDSTRGQLVARLATVGVAAALIVSARGVTPLFVAVIVVVGVLLASRARLLGVLRSRATWIVGGLTLVYLALCAWWIVRPPRYDMEGLPSVGVGESPLTGALTSIARTVQHWDELVNWYGWQDTEGPDATALLLPALAIALVVAAVAVVRRATALPLLLALAAFLLIPVALSAALMPSVGYIWLGRYMLAPLALLLVVAGVVLDDAIGESRVATRIARVAIVVWAACQVLAAVWILRRFAVGYEGSWAAYLRSPEWQPPLLVLPTIVGFVVLSGVAGVLLDRVAHAAPPEPRAVAADDPRDDDEAPVGAAAPVRAEGAAEPAAVGSATGSTAP